MFFSKKKKKEKTPLKLFCIDDDPISYAASFLALCRQVNIEIEWVDTNDSSEYSALISSTDSLPLLQDGDFSACRNFPVITYLNYVGSKPKIVPRKARILARQNYYCSSLLPQPSVKPIHWLHYRNSQNNTLIGALVI